MSKLITVFAAFLLTAERSDYESLLKDFIRLARAQITRYGDDTPFERKVHCDFAVGELLSLNDWMPGLMNEKDAEKAVGDLRLPNPKLTIQTPNEKTAAHMAVQRLHGGVPFSLAKIPYAKRKYFGGRISRLCYTLLDGKHTVLEALRITDAMLRKNTSEEQIGNVIACLRYLAGYGYVEILHDDLKK